MSGCGRKHRAKHLVTQYLDDAWDGPEKEGDLLAVCVAAPSAKHVHVVMVVPPTDAGAEKKAKVDETAEPTAAPASEAGENAADAEPERFVASLPGKFNKVLWLGCGDLVVLRLGTVHYKPSPQQLKYFYGTPMGMAWEPSIQRAETAAVALFKKVQSQTVTTVANQNLSGGGKFVVRAQEGAAAVADAHPSTDASSAVAVTKTTKYSAKSSAAAHYANAKSGGGGEASDGEEGSDADDLDNFVNPNRQNIKHRRQAFFPDEDEEEEDEEEEGEEEEDEEEDE